MHVFSHACPQCDASGRGCCHGASSHTSSFLLVMPRHGSGDAHRGAPSPHPCPKACSHGLHAPYPPHVWPKSCSHGLPPPIPQLLPSSQPMGCHASSVKLTPFCLGFRSRILMMWLCGWRPRKDSLASLSADIIEAICKVLATPQIAWSSRSKPSGQRPLHYGQ